jgi:4'-phosphopantetheinyl transferase
MDPHMERENNSIHVACLNAAQISDLEFQLISAKVRTWTHIPDTPLNDNVLRKHILGKWLTFSLLSMYGVTPEVMKNITVSAYGKPFLPDDRVSFNISHSGGLVVGVATRNGNVGVDVEHIRPVDWKEYQDCFSIQEWRAISFTDDPNRRLLEAWTKKESLVKADGRGLQITLTDVILDEDLGIIAGEDKKWFIRHIPIHGHIAHVCSEFPVTDLRMISEKEIIPNVSRFRLEVDH